MIKKIFELDKINFEKNNIGLFYGLNQGLKDEAIENILRKAKLPKTVYFESEILDNNAEFFDSITSKSFFESKKIIIIKKATDKIQNIIAEIVEKEIQDIIIILDAEELLKRSKLRNLFEKNKKLICTPFYPDNYQSLSKITENFFLQNKVPVSRDIINLIVERANGERKHLKDELKKIENYMLNKKEIKYSEIEKLINLGSDYSISELVDYCLSKNKNKLLKIVNENNFSSDETMIIIRTFLIKTKRLYLLRKESDKENDIEKVISEFKPPIFWKDKDLVKQQINLWSTKNVSKLLLDITNTELLIKKNFNNSINILLDFIYTQSVKTNN